MSFHLTEQLYEEMKPEDRKAKEEADRKENLRVKLLRFQDRQSGDGEKRGGPISLVLDPSLATITLVVTYQIRYWR